LPTHHPKIHKAHVEEINAKAVLSVIDKLLKELYSYSNDEVVQVMKDLIPEYHSTNGKFKKVKGQKVIKP
ncbi:MAG: hypothetical protein IH591_14065, partial [Bacteroidales bacterium]|nr:hypothetical protein [Bacteroidales bacterium]